MFKKINVTILFVAAAVLVYAPEIVAEPMHSGVARFTQPVDAMHGVSTRIGYKHKAFKNLRVEEQISYKQNGDLDNVSDSYKFMSNVVYDMNKISIFTPYIGVGAGVQTTNFDSHSSDMNIEPSYQVMTGVLYESEDISSLKLQFGYNYSSYIENKSDNDYYAKQEFTEDGHTISAGILLNF